MKVYQCDVHGLRLVVDEERRKRKLQWPMAKPMPSCELLIRDPIPTGTVGTCSIRLVQEG